MPQENVEAFKRGQVSEPLADPFVSSVHRRIPSQPRQNPRLPLDLEVGVLKHRFDVSAVVRVEFRDLFETLGEIHLDYPEIRDLGDCVVGIGRIRARGTESGAETESPHATVVVYQNGMAIRVRSYFDPKAALEAAGLRE